MSTPDEILQWSTECLRKWLRSLPVDEEMAWNALGEGAAMAALSPTVAVDSGRRETLGDVAIFAFRRAVAANPTAETGALISEVVLRAGLIHLLGPNAGTARDPADLWRPVEGAIAPVEALRHLIASGPIDPTTVSIERLRRLRHVKNVLRGAELVLSQESIERPDAVDWWWRHRASLP